MALEYGQDSLLHHIERTLNAAEGIRAESGGLVRDKEQVDVGHRNAADSDGICSLTKRQLPVIPDDGVHTDTSAKGNGSSTLAVNES